ncbi:MAG: hypothetical protein Q4B28_04010 [bacterium]|nr:hypothetical protein [bacterium]
MEGAEEFFGDRAGYFYESKFFVKLIELLFAGKVEFVSCFEFAMYGILDELASIALISILGSYKKRGKFRFMVFDFKNSYIAKELIFVEIGDTIFLLKSIV